MKRFLKKSTLYFTALVIGSSEGLVYFTDTGVSRAQSSPATPVPNLPGQAAPSNNLNFIANVVQEVGPAVVRIDATRTVDGPFASNPFFERFFGNQFPLPEQRVQRGTGSGFIVSADGRLLTNAHVVADADQVTVVLKDGRRFAGQVLGSDPVTDIAVVKIEATGLPTVELGNSDKIVPGQWANAAYGVAQASPLVIL